jgi:glycosyltransferase involved in cell wall biosynthesis
MTGQQDCRYALFVGSLGMGGVERAMALLARKLAEQGLNIDLVAVKAEGENLDRIPNTVRIIDLDAPRAIAAIPKLMQYLRQNRPQAMIAAQTYINLVALWARKRAGGATRVIVCEHSTLSVAASRDPNRRGKILPTLARWFYPQADAIVAVSSGVADDLAQVTGISRDKIQVIYNPIAVAEIQEKAKQVVEHAWFRPGEPPVIVSVGRLAPAKDYLNLMRAFAILKKTTPARLMIIGEGSEREHLEALARELDCTQDIELPGMMLNPFPYVARSAIFALSSRWEGLPTSLIEALACGTPVVATDCKSGPAEILDGGRYGKLVPIGDPVALAEAIRCTLQHPIPADTLKQRAEYFDELRGVAQYVRLLGE